jgi:SagB-type dehydrogenase family enzyme
MSDDELDETTWPAWRDAMARHTASLEAPRSYPGVPTVELPAPKAKRVFALSLERALTTRRTATKLGTELPEAETLSKIIALAHGVTGEHARGPTPSAGGLQALELYVATWAPGWLPAGWYHVDRAQHRLARLVEGATREELSAIMPSLAVLEGGALVWIVVGDHARVAARYTTRAARFLLLEAGHLMQNLQLASLACEHTTVPLGGFFERALAQQLALPRTDRVLYAGALG